MRLIDADRALEIVRNRGIAHPNAYHLTNYATLILREAPTVDAVPVRHGRWIKESDGGTRCSVCNKRVRNVAGGWYEPVDLSDMPYCPKCGAKMDEPVEENKK